MKEALFQKLIDNQITLAAAESCTGGLVSSKIVAYPGISSVFLAGLVTYSNQAKMDFLEVDPRIIERYGAVSSQCAVAMAEGVRRVTGARCGVSTTGIAGPGGGTDKKPVGLIYIAVSYGDDTIVKQLKLDGDRLMNMEAAAEELLNLLGNCLNHRLTK